jgi:hypothetical protein
VDDQQRQRVRLGRADVHEVDPLAVDGGGELRVLVEPGLLGAPVVAALPVPGELPQVAERHATAPADTGQLVGPAGAGQPVGQVVQLGLGNLDPERVDAVASHASPFAARAGRR